MSDSQEQATARLLLLLASFGHTVSSAMAKATGEPDLVGNTPILIMSSIELAGPKRPSELTEVTGLSSGGLSKVLDRMEALGAISRKRGVVPGDGRAVLVSLTERGHRLIRSMRKELTARLPESRALVAEIARVIEL